MELTFPKTVKIRHAGKAGYFGIKAFSKAIETLGAELHPNGRTVFSNDDERLYFEKELNLKEGELKPHSKWWDDVFNVEHPLRLSKSKTNELILDNAINQLRYKVALWNTKIGNSEAYANTPGILFYIVDEEAKAKMELESINFEFEGMQLIMKSSPEEKRGALRLFGKKGIETFSEDILSARLYQELKQDPKNFFTIMTDKNLKARMFIKECEEYHLIKRKGNTYYYGEDVIGISTEQTIEWFNDIKNEPTKLILGSKLKKLKKEKE